GGGEEGVWVVGVVRETEWCLDQVVEDVGAGAHLGHPVDLLDPGAAERAAGGDLVDPDAAAAQALGGGDEQLTFPAAGLVRGEPVRAGEEQAAVGGQAVEL